MARILAGASHELRSVRGVDNVTGHLGRAVTGDQVVDVNSGELWVSIGRDADYDATKARIETVVAGYPGLAHDVATYERQRIATLPRSTTARPAAWAPGAATSTCSPGPTGGRCSCVSTRTRHPARERRACSGCSPRSATC
jgi:hypothetical protein